MNENGKWVKWIGHNRLIPGCGLAMTGQKIFIFPTRAANSYIAQGMAEVFEDEPKKEMSTKKEVK